IIIPAYNEEKNIGKVLDSLHQWVPGIPILVINDGSSDQTRDIGRDHGAEVITLPFNSGYGVALQTGFLYAVKNEFSPVIQMDADGQHDPRYICDLLREVQRDEVDVAIGSRFLGGRKYQTSLARQAGMYLFGKIASLFCKQKVSDPTSGFQ
ncbi:MAG: glycosyltransferase, partial [Nitrospinaceae bacterium]|nr:glycosyltransferase family 2 protein [Nitrospinaceae bacterium]NIR54142.1 glycosyltransferase family 2 protein [Nitrospinaceae bacterium]NIS84556.1 glycosyltransferase family 2 protein [Nitrospinaceae bacterium]NIT81348.1 glycosyltransferase family 2 protein [Nitrospinaceae bacterium]NIU43635.1 glycosyltransferase family 2 protein [Nitrospinaceae bacterium]